MAQLLQPDERALKLYDSLPQAIGLCGSDTHGLIDPARSLNAWRLLIPAVPIAWVGPPHGQEHAAAPPGCRGPSDEGGQLRRDSDWILARLRAGDAWCVAGVAGRAPASTFAAYPQPAGGPPRAGQVSALVLTVPRATVGRACGRVLCDGREVATNCGEDEVVLEPGAGLWRAELSVAMPKLPWGRRTVPVAYSPHLRVWSPL